MTYLWNNIRSVIGFTADVSRATLEEGQARGVFTHGTRAKLLSKAIDLARWITTQPDPRRVLDIIRVEGKNLCGQLVNDKDAAVSVWWRGPGTPHKAELAGHVWDTVMLSALMWDYFNPNLERDGAVYDVAYTCDLVVAHAQKVDDVAQHVPAIEATWRWHDASRGQPHSEDERLAFLAMLDAGAYEAAYRFMEGA